MFAYKCAGKPVATSFKKLIKDLPKSLKPLPIGTQGYSINEEYRPTQIT